MPPQRNHDREHDPDHCRRGSPLCRRSVRGQASKSPSAHQNEAMRVTGRQRGRKRLAPCRLKMRSPPARLVASRSNQARHGESMCDDPQRLRVRAPPAAENPRQNDRPVREAKEDHPPGATTVLEAGATSVPRKGRPAQSTLAAEQFPRCGVAAF